MARDEHGSLFYAFVVAVKCNNHNVVEAMAARYVGQWIKDNDVRKCILL